MSTDTPDADHAPHAGVLDGERVRDVRAFHAEYVAPAEAELVDALEAGDVDRQSEAFVEWSYKAVENVQFVETLLTGRTGTGARDRGDARHLAILRAIEVAGCLARAETNPEFDNFDYDHGAGESLVSAVAAYAEAVDDDTRAEFVAAIAEELDGT